VKKYVLQSYISPWLGLRKKRQWNYASLSSCLIAGLMRLVFCRHGLQVSLSVLAVLNSSGDCTILSYSSMDGFHRLMCNLWQCSYGVHRLRD
jgi:hypothetical protein